jgi:hypothetical protein
MIRDSIALLEELEIDGDLAERCEKLHNDMSDSDYLQCFLLLQMSLNNKKLCTLY